MKVTEQECNQKLFQQSDCDRCGRQISSARQIAKPGTALCDKCANATVDLHEEER